MDGSEASKSQPMRQAELSPDSIPKDSSGGDSSDMSTTLSLPQNDNIQQSTSARASVHAAVHREDISSTTIREGDNLLEELDVDVYDQQTYERSVFDQVDKAITQVGSSRQEQSVTSSSKLNDLMRLIHHPDGHQSNDEQVPEFQDNDEQVLQLTRLQRLNRVIKTEETDRDCASQTNHLSRIPRISRVATSGQPIETDFTRSEPHIDVKPFINRSLQSVVKSEPVEDTSNFEDDRAGGHYNLSAEYRQEDSSEEIEDDCDDEEDIDYVTDSQEEQDELSVADEADLANRNGKKIRDDGDFKSYSSRIKALIRDRAKVRLNNLLDDGTEFANIDEMVTIEGDLQIPKATWDNLYEHQKTGVRWLWELHQLGTGGILGDEMGLGKTIQMIAFLVALKTSNIRSAHKDYRNLGPTVLICPATVMHQWLQEFRKWYPQLRVAILHSTGTFAGDRKQLIRVIHKSNGILICSYPGVIIYQDYLHALDWHYAILDEGHKIRNPDAQVTLACKRFRTPHRIILSGSPVQNNLRELWSIFDFIYPGKLGTLPVFMGQFSIPITQGGYANASDLQVQIAYKCACVLRDTIKPFLLRRSKVEVNNKLKLPDRSEQVLFCKLTEKQRKSYQAYLESPTVRDIKRGMCQIFVGLIQLRKICNHPDLFDASECNRQVEHAKLHKDKKLKHLEFFSSDETYGHYQKSGKMMVVDALLRLWKKQGNKVLLFTQSRQMLKLFVNFMKERDYAHLTMDGSTPIGVRHSLIEDFNTNEDIFVFLLTTRVGGVGVNLIGANRIIIYDPDWNPSTDIQARERAWRIGQQRQVIIYRLLTAGTIEEKIYHRQVFKLYLTNRVLKDAKQKRFFKTNDLHELFTLGHDEKNIETKALFDEDLQINAESIKESRDARRKEKKERRKREKEERKQSKKQKLSGNENAPNVELNLSLLSEQKKKEMREQAKRLSQMIAHQYGTATSAITPDNSVKLEPNLAFDVETKAVESSNSVKTEPVVLPHEAVMSPTLAIPYCPAWLTRPEIPTTSAPAAGSSKDSGENRKIKRLTKYLLKQDVYKPNTEHDKDDCYERDDYILGRLFKNSNISGALKHDRIESDSTADFKVVESEAEKVARDAIRTLRESRRLCLGSHSGIPNWTGRNGQYAASTIAKPRLIPKNKARAQQTIARQATTSGSSEGSILSSIKKRNQSNPISLMRGNSTLAAMNFDEEEQEEQRNRDFVGRAKDSGAEDMAEKIRNFVLFKAAQANGEAQTEEILQFFKANFDSGKTAIFKAILYKMCEFQRKGDKGFWRLRDDFRNL